MSFTGTWKSNFGDLKLIQNGERVHGLYRDLGVIEAIKESGTNRILGTFTNTGRQGKMRFAINANGSAFAGMWNWGDREPDIPNWDNTLSANEWEGERKSRKVETATKAGDSWEGTWESTYGTLHLHQNGTRLYGLYRDLGIIEGERVGTSRKVRGRFTKMGREGWFSFEIAPNGKSFSGEYGWAPGEKEGDWNGNLLDVRRNEDSGNTDDPVGSQMQIVKGGIERVEEHKISNSEQEESTPAGYVCVTHEYNVDATFNENYILSNAESELYIGNIVDGKALSDKQIVSVNGTRQPYTISTSYGGRKVTVTNPSLSEVRRLLNQTLPSGTTPAQINYEKKTIKSQQDLRVFLKAGYDDGLTNIKASGGYQSTSKSNVVAIKFIQLYYTVDVDRPSHLTSNAFFRDGTQLDDDMLIISQIGFGRMLFFLIETNYSEEDIEAAVKYAGKYGTRNIDAELELEYKAMLETSKINVFAIGDGASNVMNVINGGVEAMGDYLLKGADFSRSNPGSPIFVKFAFVKDWAPASIKFSTKVTRTECIRTVGKFDVSFDWMGVLEEDDGPGRDEDLYLITWCTLYVKDQNNRTTKVDPTNFNYLDRHGRIYEILPDNNRSVNEGEAVRLMNTPVRFEVNAKRYGYDSFDEMAPNAYFSIRCQVKENDDERPWDNDDVFRKEKKEIYLNKAFTKKIERKSEVMNTYEDPAHGFFYCQNDDSRVIVTYSITPVSS